MRARYAAPGLLLVLLLAACGSGAGGPLVRVFQAPTWSGGEYLRYQLRDRDDIRGHCDLSAEGTEEPGVGRLAANCSSPDGRYRDDRWVEVEESTLRPLRSERRIADLEKGTETVFRADYGAEAVRLTANAGGKRNETTRPLPTPSAESPDPGYYDDTSLFWVVRGAPLDSGYEGAFIDINAGNARSFRVELVVTGSASVEVPAGRFETWEVEIRTDTITQTLWVEKELPRRIVRARIERDLYELLP